MRHNVAPLYGSSGTTFALSALPEGAAGVRETLRRMSILTREGVKNPVIFMRARALVRGLKSKDYVGEAKAVHAFVRDKIRYVRDPRGVETLHTPEKLLELAQGDCDDKSILAATLLESLGHPTRFIAVGFDPDHYCHVYVETRIGAKWIPIETTEPWEFGRPHPKPVTKMIHHN